MFARLSRSPSMTKTELIRIVKAYAEGVADAINMTEHKYKELSQEEFISWLVRYGCNAERLLKAAGDMIAD